MISNEDQAGVDTRIDTIVEHRSTPALVRSFFDPNGPFAAASFDLVGLEGVDPDVIGVADLLAVTFMDVTIRPLAARRILGSDADRLTGLLRDVPGEGDLWDAGDDVLDRAEAVWEALRAYDGIDETTAGKLLARKRPRLVPVVDFVVRKAVAAPGGTYWKAFRSALRDLHRRERIERLRPDSLDGRVSTLRVLDAAIWMTASAGEAARAARQAADTE